MTFCPNCGKELPTQVPNFCPNCGKSTQVQTASPQPLAPAQAKAMGTNRFRILAALGLLVLLLAIPLPWLTVNILGQYNISLLNIINLLSSTSSSSSNLGVITPQISQALGSVLPSLYALIAALGLYGLTVIFGILSIAFRKMTAPTGILAILTGILWIVGVESFKSAIVQYAQSLGGGLAGSLGSGFAGLFGGAIASAISAGTGVYVVILSGIIFLAARFLK